MKTSILACTLFIAIAAVGEAYAGNFVGGIAAYRRGDFPSALSGLRSLAESGDASSQYYLGLMNLNGQGLPKDEGQAFQWFEKSARQGYAKAQNALGEMYFHARGTGRDYGQAEFWLRKAANRGLVDAQRNLGATYAYAMEPHDYKKAVFWLERAARQGDDIDQLTLATMLHDRSEVKDVAKSAFWMRKSANQGNAEAQNALGNYYHSGDGVAQDYAKAMYWYKQASSQGHELAPYSIAQMHAHGSGVPEDQRLAVEWFCKAARQGNGNGLYALQQAGPQATACLIELAKGGNLLAQEELGRFYENAIGAVHDYALAAFWYRQAAERGYAGGLTRLGDLTARGNGVAKDPVIALMLYLLAQPGSDDAQYRSRLGQPLSDVQLNEARSLAIGWKAGTPLPEKSETGDALKP